AAPVLGVTVTPLPWLRCGLAWRGEIDLGLKLDVLANVNVAGAITGDALISLRAINFFTPHKVALGVAASPLPGGPLHAEVDWLGWSHFTGALPDLRVRANLGIMPPFVDAVLPQARFRDVWVPRLGIELKGSGSHITWMGRLGYAFEPSP